MQLKEEIAVFKEAREREKPQALEVEAKVKELQEKLDNLNSLQLNLKKERQAMKEKAQEMENSVRSVTLLLSYILFYVIVMPCFLEFQWGIMENKFDILLMLLFVPVDGYLRMHLCLNFMPLNL